MLFRVSCGMMLLKSQSFKSRITVCYNSAQMYSLASTLDVYKQAVVCTSSYKSSNKIGLTQLGMA